MREEAPPKGIYVGDANRGNLARDLALTAGVPPLLCANALQIFSDRAAQAMMWLLDQGSLHRADVLNPDRVDFQKVVDKDSIWDWIQVDEEDDMENEDEEEEDGEDEDDEEDEDDDEEADEEDNEKREEDEGGGGRGV